MFCASLQVSERLANAEVATRARRLFRTSFGSWPNGVWADCCEPELSCWGIAAELPTLGPSSFPSASEADSASNWSITPCTSSPAAKSKARTRSRLTCGASADNASSSIFRAGRRARIAPQLVPPIARRAPCTTTHRQGRKAALWATGPHRQRTALPLPRLQPAKRSRLSRVEKKWTSNAKRCRTDGGRGRRAGGGLR
eukprot:scaffold215501_cov28-Tisochrysis_lutea.AAC.2